MSDDIPPAAAGAPRAGRESADQSPFRLKTQQLSTVRAQPVSWLWPGYIPLGKVTMLDGLPDLGKSTIALDLGARTTCGGLMPDDTPSELDEPADVVLFTAEDGIADTVRPRVDAAGGRPERVHVVKATIITTGTTITERCPDLRHDLAALEATVNEHRARLVIVDVFAAYVGIDTDMHRDQAMRAVMGPLAEMAERRGCAVLLLRHPTKAGHSNPVLAGGMSIAIIGAARVGLLAAVDPDDPDEDLNTRRRLLAVAKCNIAPKSATMAYRLVQAPGDLAAHVRWEGKTHHRASELTATHAYESDDPSIRAFVADLLEPGPLLAVEVNEHIRMFGTTRKTALRHLNRLGGQSVKLSGPLGDVNRGWAWTLTPPLVDDQKIELAARYDALEEDRRTARKRSSK